MLIYTHFSARVAISVELKVQVTHSIELRWAGHVFPTFDKATRHKLLPYLQGLLSLLEQVLVASIPFPDMCERVHHCNNFCEAIHSSHDARSTVSKRLSSKQLLHPAQLLPNPSCSSPYMTLTPLSLSRGRACAVFCALFLMPCNGTAYCSDTASSSLPSSTILGFHSAPWAPVGRRLSPP